jgi:hypothetical protein
MYILLPNIVNKHHEGIIMIQSLQNTCTASTLPWSMYQTGAARDRLPAV